jgi:hypothetical protein
MICYCPYCSETLPKILVNGVSFCNHCNKIIISSEENELVSAYRLLKKRIYVNDQQVKHDLRLDIDKINFLFNCLDEEYSIEEFEKIVKKQFFKTA